MQKLSVFTLIGILLLLISAAGAGAQDAGVQELPLRRIAILYSTDPATPEPVQEFEQNVRDRLVFSLSVIGGFEILNVQEYPENASSEQLLETARDFDLDFAGIIHAGITEQGEYTLTIAVYDAATGTEIFREDARAGNEDAIAERTEALVQETVAAGYSFEIGWSEIEVATEGAKNTLSYYIDGVFYGKGDIGITGIPSGNRLLTVKQQRPFGPTTVYNEYLELIPDNKVKAAVSLPELTEAEKEGLASIEEAIRTAWKNGDDETLTKHFAFTKALLGDVSIDGPLQEAKEKYFSWEESYSRGEIPEEVAISFKEPEDLPFEENTVPVPTGSRGGRIVKGSLLGSGIALSLAASVAGVINVENRHKTEDLYIEYLSASDNFDSLFSTYSDSYNYYKIVTLSMYGGYGGGFLLLSSGVFGFSGNPIRLSFLGKAGAALAAITGAGGSVFQHIANVQKVKNRALWADYMKASENLDQLYNDYNTGFHTYSIGRITGYALWSAGAFLAAVSPILPGVTSPVADTFAGKLLLSAGALMIAGGNMTSGFAHGFLLESQNDFNDYLYASANLDDLYDKYSGSFQKYQISSYVSYGLWTAGTVSILTSVFVPFRRGKARPDRERPVTFSAFPATEGLTLSIHGSY